MGIFTRKSLDRIFEESGNEGESALKRSLGPISIIALGLGALLGSGVYVLLTETIADITGPSVVYSFLILAGVCSFSGLCYAELSSMFPIAGSAYTYTYATMGELLAWILGWDLLLEYSIVGAAAAVSCSTMLRQLYPSWIHLTPFGIDCPAVLLILFVSTILFGGVRESAGFQGILVLVKLSVLGVFIVAGYKGFQWANLHPFIPPNDTGVFGHFGISGIFRGAGTLFFVFIGFEAVATVAQEARNPQRDIRNGLLATLTISTVIYVAFALILMGNLPFKSLGDASLSRLYGRMFKGVIPLILTYGTAVGLISAILVSLLGQSRVLFALANDGLLPKVFRSIHPRFRTPIRATQAAAVSSAIAAAILPLRLLVQLTSIGTMLTFTVVCAAVLVLRQRTPDWTAGFRLPLYPWIPIAGIVANILLMCSLESSVWLRLGTWLMVGLPIYFLYGLHHSRAGQEQARSSRLFKPHLGKVIRNDREKAIARS